MQNRLIRMNNVSYFDAENSAEQISFRGVNAHRLLSHEERAKVRARTGSSPSSGGDSS